MRSYITVKLSNSFHALVPGGPTISATAGSRQGSHDAAWYQKPLGSEIGRTIPVEIEMWRGELLTKFANRCHQKPVETERSPFPLHVSSIYKFMGFQLGLLCICAFTGGKGVCEL